jgi:hypothetical protein
MHQPRQSFKPELIVCVLLMLGVILAWMSFFLFLDHTSGERAAFWFIQNHLGLGETPDFVLHIAGHGLPQPAMIIITWREFQCSLLIALLLIAGLAWLEYRLWLGHQLWKAAPQRTA